MNKLYIIGSLRNPKIPQIANEFRKRGINVFDDWYSPGPKTDDHWKDYELARGRTFKQALQGDHAKTVFNFDKYHLSTSDAVILVLPAGKSGHMELGWMLGQEKKGYILLEPGIDRWDIMYQFADGIFETEEEMYDSLCR